MNPIIPRVTGYITKVYVKDNDFVKKGDTLFIIDNKDYIVKVADAQAGLAAAQSGYTVTLYDTNETVLEKAQQAITKNLKNRIVDTEGTQEKRENREILIGVVPL